MRFKKGQKNIIGLIDLILTMPASSADAERGFSEMKMPKTDYRTRWRKTVLNDLLMVHFNTPNVKEFDSLSAIHLWNSGGQRLRRFMNNVTEQEINEILKTPQEQIISYQSTSPASSSRQTSPNKPPTPPYQPCELNCICIYGSHEGESVILQGQHVFNSVDSGLRPVVENPGEDVFIQAMLRLQYGLDSYHLTRGSAVRAASGEIVHSGQWVKSLKGDEDTWIGSFREKEKGASSKPRKRIYNQDPNAYSEYVSAQKRGKNSCPNFLEVPIFRNFQKI
ncbi:unnamed protein product [Mytilus coruscus]|uniref:HAT C-terminal dimerisation domain-containing protein n=1 Tax=Mytilus coruscus TaxID=42192 RepID=A0A6J8DR87_MYTCO|nr:unnamed protein product [Mytilus coruscus]